MAAPLRHGTRACCSGASTSGSRSPQVSQSVIRATSRCYHQSQLGSQCLIARALAAALGDGVLEGAAAAHAEGLRAIATQLLERLLFRSTGPPGAPSPLDELGDEPDDEAGRRESV